MVDASGERQDRLPSGSFLVATNATKAPLPPATAAAYDAALAGG
jgi:hypothetical protein